MLSTPARYRDQRGEAQTTLYNDGKTLRITIRGVTFSGDGFTSLAPSADATPQQLAPFDLLLGMLYSFSLDCTFPLGIAIGDDTTDGQLDIHIESGEMVPLESGRVGRMVPATSLAGPEHRGEEPRIPDISIIRLRLRYRDMSFVSHGKSGYDTFDEQMFELWPQLPTDTYARCCHTCAFSDYDPVGSGEFGWLACFRNTKDAYRMVKTKRDLSVLWKDMAEFVQETAICPEYERRVPGTDFRQ